jgi:tetratricopeptide (TPR) repeat protein
MIITSRPRAFRPRLAGIALATALLVGGSYAVSWAARPPAVPANHGAGAAGPAASITPVTGFGPAAPPAGASELLLARFDRAIRAWNGNVASNPGDYVSATNLGSVYVGRARLTGDLGDYERALAAADRAIEIDPSYVPARSLRATILFAVHDFGAALAEARVARGQDGGDLQALAIAGDASLELGDVDAARLAYAELERLAPSAPVFSRLARLAFLEGRTDAAVGLVERALDAVASEPASEATAFYAYQLGELRRARGEVALAVTAYEQALDDLPGYVPAAAGLAHVREAQGRRAEAISLLEAATARLPQPELVAALGDLYALAGDPATAERQYELVERIAELAVASGSVYDRQLILFAADHDRGLPAAVARARAELAVRPDIYAHDALAWVLFKSGHLDEAAAEMDVALALGTRDPRLAYHAGMIAAAQGRGDDARRLLSAALEGKAYLPPVQVPVIEEALAGLAPQAAP